MTTTTVTIPKSVAGNAAQAEAYEAKLRQLMLSHGFRKTRFKVTVDANNHIKATMTQGSDAGFNWFSGFAEGMEAHAAMVQPVITKQSKQIKLLEQKIEALQAQVNEVEREEPNVKHTIDFATVFAGLISQENNNEEESQPRAKRH